MLNEIKPGGGETDYSSVENFDLMPDNLPKSYDRLKSFSDDVYKEVDKYRILKYGEDTPFHKCYPKTKKDLAEHLKVIEDVCLKHGFEFSTADIDGSNKFKQDLLIDGVRFGHVFESISVTKEGSWGMSITPGTKDDTHYAISIYELKGQGLRVLSTKFE